MYKQCQTEQSTARQRQLEQGLLQIMQKRHYDEISVSDLCEELGIPRKSFYRYFASKDGGIVRADRPCADGLRRPYHLSGV